MPKQIIKFIKVQDSGNMSQTRRHHPPHTELLSSLTRTGWNNTNFRLLTAFFRWTAPIAFAWSPFEVHMRTSGEYDLPPGVCPRRQERRPTNYSTPQRRLTPADQLPLS